MTKAVIATVLVGCLIYGYWLDQIDLNPPDPSTAPVSLDPVTALNSDGAESAMKREEEPPLLFGEYPCGDDCSEHLAGYRWARDNGVSEPDNCDGRTAPFIEGCRVYAEQQKVDVVAK